MNIILCGLQTSGKTTVGKLLADTLAWRFIDTDTCIETAYKHKTEQTKTCREISDKHGEAFFRALENEQILSLKETKLAVIALGGGSLIHPDHVTLVRSIGHLIYLKAPMQVLLDRILKDGGTPSYLDPLDLESSFYEVATRRTPVFEQAAHLTIETNELSPGEVMKAIFSKPECKHLRTQKNG